MSDRHHCQCLYGNIPNQFLAYIIKKYKFKIQCTECNSYYWVRDYTAKHHMVLRAGCSSFLRASWTIRPIKRLVLHYYRHVTRADVTDESTLTYDVSKLSCVYNVTIKKCASRLRLRHYLRHLTLKLSSVKVVGFLAPCHENLEFHRFFSVSNYCWCLVYQCL